VELVVGSSGVSADGGMCRFFVAVSEPRIFAESKTGVKRWLADHSRSPRSAFLPMR
jgi:hypothetical protein